MSLVWWSHNPQISFCQLSAGMVINDFHLIHSCRKLLIYKKRLQSRNLPKWGECLLFTMYCLQKYSWSNRNVPSELDAKVCFDKANLIRNWLDQDDPNLQFIVMVLGICLLCCRSVIILSFVTDRARRLLEIGSRLIKGTHWISDCNSSLKTSKCNFFFLIRVTIPDFEITK